MFYNQQLIAKGFSVIYANSFIIFLTVWLYHTGEKKSEFVSAKCKI